MEHEYNIQFPYAMQLERCLRSNGQQQAENGIGRASIQSRKYGQQQRFIYFLQIVVASFVSIFKIVDSIVAQ